ncbi:MAG: hypothetical protein NTU54_07795 [Candidatus Omnitrophica bacterium]|nr:hypothetical protein [Candidatus Omnitrophota bacterium]
MPKDNIPPEERLLRLIRGQDKTAGAKDAQAPLPPQDTKPQLKSQRHNPLIRLSLKFSLKKALLLAFVLSAIYLAAVFFFPLFYSDRIDLPQAQPGRNAALQSGETKQNRQPLEHYLNALHGRDIFVNQLAQTKNGAPGALAADLIKDMSLVGIISGVDPQVIIEDKKMQKTYYLKKGQSIGELQIEDIQEGKIIISHNGEKFELYL